MVLRGVNENNMHIYTLLTIKSYFQKTDIINFANFVTIYHTKN